MPTPAATETLDIRALLSVLSAFRRGDFSARLPLDWTGNAGKVADHLNAVLETNQRMGEELERVGRVVGKEGKIGERISRLKVGDGRRPESEMGPLVTAAHRDRVVSYLDTGVAEGATPSALLRRRARATAQHDGLVIPLAAPAATNSRP